MTNTQYREVVLRALAHLNSGEITEAIACFAEEFQFRDRGLGLEFKNQRRLAEFFRKIRELYPDFTLQTDQIIVSSDHLIAEWTLRTTLTEPFYGGQSRKVAIV